MFWTRFIELCNKAQKSPNCVAADLGFSSSVCTVWKKGAVPRDATIKKIADYFNVTADYLLGNVDLPFLFKDEKGLFDFDLYALTETEKPTPVSGSGPDKNVIKIAGRDGSFVERKLTDEQMAALRLIIDQLPDAEEL